MVERLGEQHLSDGDVDRIARRLVELLGDKTVRDVAGESTVSESAKMRFANFADELAADSRPFRDLSHDERKARLQRVVGIGREIFSPSEEVARRKEEEIELEERRFGR
jgi:hypothetical protein